eukprot:765988-Hanusia_phi.AAC.28
MQLVIGGDTGGGRRTLLGRLEGEHRPPFPSISTSRTDEASAVLHVENKYFNAEVKVQVVEKVDEVRACQGEGVIEGDPSELLQDAENWCFLHQIEFVHCSALKDVFSYDRDSEGLDRILEAVGNHTWSNLVRKDTKQQKGHPQDLNYDKWNKLHDDEEDEQDKKDSETERSPLMNAANLRDSDVIIDADKSLQEVVDAMQATEAQKELLEEIFDMIRRPDMKTEHFFLDSSILDQISVGANAAVHVNRAHALPIVAQFLSTAHVVLNENPHLLQLPVRNSLWCSMVEGQRDVEKVLPIAIVWSLLESCVAEGTSRFYIRIMSSKVRPLLRFWHVSNGWQENVAQWLENCVIPAALR